MNHNPSFPYFHLQMNLSCLKKDSSYTPFEGNRNDFQHECYLFQALLGVCQQPIPLFQ